MDPFRKLEQKQRRDARKQKAREMGISGRGVKLLNRLTQERAREAQRRYERRQEKNGSEDF